MILRKHGLLLFFAVTALSISPKLSFGQDVTLDELRAQIEATKQLCEILDKDSEPKAECFRKLDLMKAALNKLDPPSQLAATSNAYLRVEQNGHVLQDYSFDSLQTRSLNIVTAGTYDRKANKSAGFSIQTGGGIREKVEPVASVSAAITTKKALGTIDIVGGQNVLRLAGTTQVIPIRLVEIPILNIPKEQLNAYNMQDLNYANFKLQIVPLTAEGQATFEKYAKANGADGLKLNNYSFTVGPELQAQLPIGSLRNRSAITQGASGLPISAMFEVAASPAAATFAGNDNGNALAIGPKASVHGQTLLALGNDHYIDLGLTVQGMPSFFNAQGNHLDFAGRAKAWAQYKKVLDSNGNTFFVGPQIEGDVANVKALDGQPSRGNGVFDNTRYTTTINVGYQGSLIN